MEMAQIRGLSVLLVCLAIFTSSSVSSEDVSAETDHLALIQTLEEPVVLNLGSAIPGNSGTQNHEVLAAAAKRHLRRCPRIKLWSTQTGKPLGRSRPHRPHPSRPHPSRPPPSLRPQLNMVKAGTARTVGSPVRQTSASSGVRSSTANRTLRCSWILP